MTQMELSGTTSLLITDMNYVGIVQLVLPTPTGDKTNMSICFAYGVLIFT